MQILVNLAVLFLSKIINWHVFWSPCIPCAILEQVMAKVQQSMQCYMIKYYLVGLVIQQIVL